MSTALTQLYYHTMARPRVVSEKESLLEGESGPTPAEKTLPTPCQQDRSWPSLEDGNGALRSEFFLAWDLAKSQKPHFYAPRI